MNGEETDFIAVVGLACRFPQAPDVDTFWDNLRRGVESITELSEEEIAALPEELRDHEQHVKASARLDGLDLFDASFFGLTSREAAAMDPQQRLFLEIGWQALERAGYAPGGAVGVYAGVSSSRYLDYLMADPSQRETLGLMQLTIGNDKDHIAPRLSYFLNLRGPSVPVQTACSASLVAVHMACQGLLNHECDLALAGGCSIPYPNRMGYVYEEGGVLSPDGRCRAFDASARGTAQGNGVGLVVLKRLEEALADGDHLHAVIRGTAINNDGAAKVGYTAPSVEGQRRVIEEAIAIAGVEPAEISYVEAHGTGTTLGDPIEIEALRQAFAGSTSGESTSGESTSSGSMSSGSMSGGSTPGGSTNGGGPTCALGSVKTNIGHCDAASGIAGLIKAILCLEHQTLVASLNFERPNPQIDFAQTPFFVNTETRVWEQTPRYAGVSSFGIGGTNAHVVLAEAPPLPTPSGPSREHQLVTLSAHTDTALESLQENLVAFLESRPEAELADVAFTLNAGRRALPCRDAVVCRDRQELLTALARKTRPTVLSAKSRPEVVFAFPGHGTGSGTEDLGQDLYPCEPAYRAAADRCFEILESLGVDLRSTFLGGAATRHELTRPALWQPAIFVAEYALAQLWGSWGLVPTAMIGHSLGEIVAATLAEVLTLEDALHLVTERGRRTAELPAGAMLAVPMSEQEIAPHLGGDIELAAVNGPGLVVLSGPVDDIDAMAEKLASAPPIRLAPRRAFHSAMVEPMLPPIAQLAAGFDLGTPKIPYLSNVTGTWMSDEDAVDPHYWARHLRHTVRFHDGLAELLQEPGRLFLEVGPGKVLTGLTNRDRDTKPAVASLGRDGEPTQRSLLTAAGQLWRRGADLDWPAFYADQERRRLPLPTYPFERQSYWFEGDSGLPLTTSPGGRGGDDPLAVKSPPEQWFFLPTWKQAPQVQAVNLEKRLEPDDDWLLFTDRESPLGEALRQQLQELGQQPILIHPGNSFTVEEDNRFVLDPSEAGDYSTLFEALRVYGRSPSRILYTWETALTEPGQPPAAGFTRLIYLAQALGELPGTLSIHLAVVTDGCEPILAEPDPDAPARATEQAALLGVVRVLPKELPQVTCQHLDVELENDGENASGPTIQRTAEALLSEVGLAVAEKSLSTERRVAFRKGQRWLPIIEPVTLDIRVPSPYRSGGVYLLTHGLQEIGLALAERLIEQAQATVVLLDRSFFPPPAEWQDWIRTEGEDDALSRKISRLRKLKDPDRVRVVTADPADGERLLKVYGEVARELGPIRGIFHLDPPSPETGLIAGKTAQEPAAQVATRIREAHHLEPMLSDELDFLVLFSSNAAESGGLGQVDQAAAYGYLESFAQILRARGHHALAIAWGTRGWQDEDDSLRTGSAIERQLDLKREHFGMSAEEFLDTLERALSLTVPQVIVSTRDFPALMEQQSQFTVDYFQQQMADGDATSTASAAASEPTATERPDLDTPYEAPRNEVEELLAEGWRLFFGLREIGVHDSFFELGGHSLLAVQILKKVNETFSTQLGLADFFDAPTIAGVAEQVSGGSADDEDAELAALLSEIEGLSEEELEAALEAQGEGAVHDAGAVQQEADHV